MFSATNALKYLEPESFENMIFMWIFLKRARSEWISIFD